MTQSIPYWHVDAFSAAPFGGNQAAVMVLDEWLSDDVLIAIGAENLFAETAFVVRDETGASDWELRWCTPTYEIALCGHATLAAGHVLLGRDGGESVTFRTRQSGILEVRRGDQGLEVALPVIPVEPTERPDLLAALGASGEVSLSPQGYQATAIVQLADEAAVRALAPDMAKLRAFDGMLIATAPGDNSDVVSRVFVPAWGVDEDSVTGSAHAALTPYWADRLGRSSFTAHQASARGGDLALRLDGTRAWLGGACVTVVEGQFHL